MRIFSAPTGSGKSYAFQRAVMDKANPARVLFVVPTRRLADNLARGLCEAMRADARYDDAEIRRRVMIWTSRERERQEAADPGINVGRLRLHQVRGWDSPERGTMTIATPELIDWALLHPRTMTPGTPPLSIVDYLRFDHIVFDEFHTIEARGMGLCVAFARAATQIPDGPKVTFLSATPVETAPTLTACDISPSDIRVAAETVITTNETTPGTSALHGDVRLCLVDAASPAQALQMRLPQARDCVSRGRKLVLVYDSLATLKSEMATLDIVLRQIGVGAEQRLLINSFDDSRSIAQDRYAAAGGDRDPADFAVLIATSSVEMGVTFDAGMMVMDPGRSPASLVQRIGRVARGDEPGHVVVAVPQGAMDREPWLRGVLNGLRGLGARFDIERFLDACLAGPRAAFRWSPREQGDDPRRVFASMPARATWSAALFYAALEQAAVTKGHRDTLRRFDFARTRAIGAILHEVRRGGRAGSAWADAMLAEAGTLRVIDPSVTLIDPSGPRARLAHRLFAASEALRRCPTRPCPKGAGIEVVIDMPLGDIAHLGGAASAPAMVHVLMPHTPARMTTPARGVIDAWLKEASRAARSSRATEDQVTSIPAAMRIVRLTGIVPVERAGIDDMAGAAQ